MNPQAYGRRQSPKATQIHATVRQPKPKNMGTSDSEMANAFTGENDPVWLIPMLRNVFSTPSVEPLRTAKIVARETGRIMARRRSFGQMA